MGHFVDIEALDDHWPTHKHRAAHWEALGRAVATFGFLESTLGRAIFALTATVEYEEREIQAKLTDWEKTLKKAISDPLGPLIESFEKAVALHQNIDDDRKRALLCELKKAKTLRNALCHGSWEHVPDEFGRAKLRFINNKHEVLVDTIDVAYLEQVQRGIAILISEVINTVTLLGYQFPGTNGPGKIITQLNPPPHTP